MHQQITKFHALKAAAASPLLQALTALSAAGSQAVNPATGKLVPIWVADYVLGNYGSGAIMAVPAHDTRDHAFAQQYSLPVLQVVKASAAEEEQQFPFTGKRASVSFTHRSYADFMHHYCDAHAALPLSM